MSAHNAKFDLHSDVDLYPDPGTAGTITVDRSPCNVLLTSGAGAETRTLARPTAVAARAKLVFKTDGGGDITLTVTGGYNEDGDTTLVFSDVGQFAIFEAAYDGTDYFWRLVATHATGNAVLAVEGVVAGVKIASGITALDGSNPTNIVTGLTTVTGFSAIVNSTDASTGTAFVTYGTISGGTVPVYAADDTGTASTGTENVAWVAVGT